MARPPPQRTNDPPPPLVNPGYRPAIHNLGVWCSKCPLPTSWRERSPPICMTSPDSVVTWLLVIATWPLEVEGRVQDVRLIRDRLNSVYRNMSSKWGHLDLFILGCKSVSLDNWPSTTIPWHRLLLIVMTLDHWGHTYSIVRFTHILVQRTKSVGRDKKGNHFFHLWGSGAITKINCLFANCL